MNPSADLVNRLWRLCALLRKDGVTYQQYVTELTYLLFLKMASEQKDESRIPEKYRWAALKSASETEVLQRYRQALIDLGDGTKIADRSVVAIFQNAATIVREPANLRKLIDAIDGLHWFSEERDAFGDTYEGLLQKMAEETKRGAGQYFTPRVLIEVMVRLMQPKPDEVIQDPAAGTGGFLIAADRIMREATDDYFELSPKQQTFQLQSALRGLEKQLGVLWRHSVQVAALSYSVARRLTNVTGDTAMLAGLLQGIGKLYILTRASRHRSYGGARSRGHAMPR